MKPAELDTYPVAHVEGLAARVAELEAENKDLRDRFSDADTERNVAQGALKAAFARVSELEARCKRLEEAGDEMRYAGVFTPKWDGTDTTHVVDAWEKAKEAKP